MNQYSTGSQHSPSVSTDNSGNFVAAWASEGQNSNNFAVAARKYDSTGTPIANEFIVNQFTTDSQTFPKVAMDGNGDFVVIWWSNLQDGSLNGTYARTFTGP